MNDLLITRDLHKTYQNGPREIEVIKGIDMTVRRGEIIVVIGPSGVGKSTLLHLIGGLDKPTQGEVIVDGQDVFAMNDKTLAAFRNAKIGFIFQFHHLLPEFSALENIMIPGMMHNPDIGGIRQSASELLKEVGLGQRMDHRPSQLSGGEQQRVAVARALINRPVLVLADEPTGNLDRRNGEALYQLILSLNRKYDQTFVIVTHNETMAEQAHRVIEMEDGRIRTIARKSPAASGRE